MKTEEGMKKMFKIWDDISEEGKSDEYIMEKMMQLFHMDKGQAEDCLREYA